MKLNHDEILLGFISVASIFT